MTTLHALRFLLALAAAASIATAVAAMSTSPSMTRVRDVVLGPAVR